MTIFTWDRGSGETEGSWTTPSNWDQDSDYPGTSSTDVAIIPNDTSQCLVNTNITIGELIVSGNRGGGNHDLRMGGTLTVTGNALIKEGIFETSDYDLTVGGYTQIYGTLDLGASDCSFGYGNTTSVEWDLAIKGTGVLVGGTGDWDIGAFGSYSGADVTLTSGVVSLSGTLGGHLWSPDQGVSSWDNNNGTVILQKTGTIRTEVNSNPFTAADKDICPFHNLIISGGADRTDAPVVTLLRGMKVDNQLIIKNGVLEWDTYAGSYGDVWAVLGTEMTGAASQSAAIVMDDMPIRSKFVSHTGSSDTNYGLEMAGNAIVSGAKADIHLGSLYLGTDNGGSNSAANNTITGLNGTPYMTYPSGEACAHFEGGSSSITLGDIDELDDTQNFTISMWIKFGSPAPAEDNKIFEKGPSGVNSTMMRWSNGSGGKLYWYINNGGSAYGRSTFSEATGIGWNHIALVFDGTFTDGDTDTQNAGRLKAYVNGVLQTQAWTGEIPSSTTNDTPTSLAVLGIAEPGSSDPTFFGKMADVRIYDESKDITAVAALAATNPATSTTGTYPSTGSGLVGWWKLQPTGSVNLDASPPRSQGTYWRRGDLTANGGELDMTDSSTSGYDATNVGTVPGWGSMNLYQRNSNNYKMVFTYQRTFNSNNTIPTGVEGRGSTVYLRPKLSEPQLYVSDGSDNNADAMYAAGRALTFNNLNICTPSAGNGEVRVQSENTGCGLVDITGDLVIASGASLVQYAHGSVSSRTDAILGDIYVSGNCGVGGSLQCNNSTYVDALDDGYISRMPNLNIGNFWLTSGGTFNATPSVTTLSSINGNTGGSGRKWFSRINGIQPGPRTFNANDGTIDCIGGVTCEYDNTDMFYNFLCSGTFETKNSMFHATNHFRTSGWGPNGTRGYNFAVRDFTLDGTFNSQTGWAGSTGSTYTVSGNARLSDGSKIYLSGGTGGVGHEGDLWYFKGNLINEGCLILGSGSW